MPGVEVHAQVLENILTKAMLSSPNYAIGAELCAAFADGRRDHLACADPGPGPAAAFGATIVALLIGASWYLFTQYKLLIDFTYPLLSSLLIYLTLVFTNFVKEQAQRRQIRSAFGQYLSPTLVEQLAQSPEKLVLGGEQREMTIMFSDVRGFTTISEIYKDDPQGLTALMNSFLTPLTNAIIDRKGTIDKYMGDAIMAFWNAPLDDPTHELNACEAALDMLDRVEKLNREREQAAKASGYAVHPDPDRCRHQHRNDASSATWAPTCASTIPCWATASISPLGWKDNASRTDFRSSSARKTAHGREGQVRHPGARFHRREGQEGAGGRLRHRRPRRSGQFRAVPALARPEHEDAVALSQSRLDGRAGRHRTGSRRRRGEQIQDALQNLCRADPHLPDHSATRRLGRSLCPGDQVGRQWQAG